MTLRSASERAEEMWREVPVEIVDRAACLHIFDILGSCIIPKREQIQLLCCNQEVPYHCGKFWGYHPVREVCAHPFREAFPGKLPIRTLPKQFEARVGMDGVNEPLASVKQGSGVGTVLVGHDVYPRFLGLKLGHSLYCTTPLHASPGTPLGQPREAP